MGKYLIYYLVLTGLGAILTLVAPGVVYLLAWVGVGLILALTPTAFIWGCIFAVGYGLARIAVRPVSATIVAGMATAITLWAIPQPSIRAADAARTQLQLRDVKPAELIRLKGDIRIQRMSPYFVPSMYGCDDSCIAFLFEPGVRSVTIARAAARTFEEMRDEISQPDKFSRTYRLVPKAQCSDEAVNLDGRRFSSPFGRTTDERRAVAAEWSMRLATEYCLTAAAPLQHYDMILRSSYWGSRDRGPPRRFDMSPDQHTARAKLAEIQDGQGEVLFRKYLVAVDALGVPFMMLPQGDALIVDWFRRFRPNYDLSEWEAPDVEMNAAIRVKRSATIGDSIANARNAVQVSFLDSAVATGPSAMLVIENYMEMLATAKPLREDIALIEHLLDDPRLSDLPRAYLLPQMVSSEQLNSFLPAIISKLSMGSSADPAGVNVLGVVLERWPKGAFENPDPAMLALLRNPDQRLRASGLVARLSDMGERGAPILADILEQHLPAIATDSVRGHLHRGIASAAVRAMCRLGPQAVSALPRMRELEKKAGPTGAERYDWDTMMMRIGKPLSDIRKIEGGGSSEHEYAYALASRLEHFDADRDCR